jgi:hypothetical protein
MRKSNKKSRKSVRKSPVKKRSGCNERYTKKYRIRKSPSYSAMDCKNRVMVGNDNRIYKSTRNSNGIYTWKHAK